MNTPDNHTIEFSPLIENLELSRVMARLGNPESGRLVVFSVGIHGNEPSALFAARNLVRKINLTDLQLKGMLLVVVGNIPALEADQRYIDEDLNRIWKPDIIESFSHPESLPSVERQQACELYRIIVDEVPVYRERFFVDFHTTSSETIPFISAHDESTCLEFAQQFPLNTVVGFPDLIPGSIDDFFRSLGFTGFTFEAGHKHFMTSLENHEALMWLFLFKSGLIEAGDLDDADECRRVLAKYTPEGRKLFKIRYRYALGKDHAFRMEPGFINFQPVHKGQTVAMAENIPVRATMEGRIFMPLYQEKGDDGFFIIQEKETAA